MKVLICSSEIVPFAKTGGLADVVGALALRFAKQGIKVVLALPNYKCINKKNYKLKNLSNTISFATIDNNIKVYFISHNFYFNRDGLYSDKSGAYKDNLDRFSFYSKQVLALIKDIDFKPDIIHCNDWQAALIPVYLKTNFKNIPFYKNIKTVLTIHNLGYQGIFSKKEFGKLDFKFNLLSHNAMEFNGKINLLRGGIIFADVVNTVSPTYAEEMLTPKFGCGLEGILSRRKTKIFGILNGLDYKIWNPQIDKFIFKKYSHNTIQDKYTNKKQLQKKLGMEICDDITLLGMVSRLTQQKGLDLIVSSIEQICKNSIQLVLLGTGEIKYHNMLRRVKKKHPKVISVHIGFDEPLAHKIYASSDIFLMPSCYEPCGLGQMISLRYGTIPLVFKTGGLADTVSSDNGFVFDRYDKDSFLECLNKALLTYNDKRRWYNLVKRAFSYNFSWEESARKYIDVYKKCLSRRANIKIN